MCNASIHFETAEKKILVGFPEETLPAASIEVGIEQPYGRLAQKLFYT